VYVVMEATGRYYEEAAEMLSEAGFVVYVVNPTVIKRYAEQELMRNKDDQIDAGVMARWLMAEVAKGEHSKQHVWQPPPLEVRELRHLHGRREELIEEQTREKNRKSAGRLTDYEAQSIETMLAFLKQQIKAAEAEIDRLIKAHPEMAKTIKRLCTIKGIGHWSAVLFVAYRFDQFEDADAAAAYAGVTPRKSRSGQRTRQTRISKIGHAEIRAALFMPTLSSMTYNKHIKTFVARLQKNTTLKGLQIIMAAMHKLIRIAFGVMKSGIDYDPNYVNPQQRKGVATA
jgi:transposase